MNNDHLHTLLSTKNKIHNTQKGHFLKYFYLESVLTFAKLFSLSTSSTNEYIVIFQHISICHLQQICNKLLFFCCLQTPKRPFYKASRTPYLSRLFIVGKNNTSLIAAESVSSIHIRSIPYPIPPVGGIPISSALRKSSSVWLASSSPWANCSS